MTPELSSNGNRSPWCGKKKLSLCSPDPSTPGRQRKVSVFSANPTSTSASSSSTSPKSLLETEPLQGSQEARQFSEK